MRPIPRRSRFSLSTSPVKFTSSEYQQKVLSYSMLLFAIVTTQHIVFSALFHDGGCHLRTRHGLGSLCIKETSARLMRARETSGNVLIDGSVFDSKIFRTSELSP
ncbi:hypothetical protein CKAH01_14945 [Colletotrichum kahawae]|uniref:Transmembrane protein n=1 Tax=Colletotrichum kahawae TaxID=34407 RepID=A0AAD9YIQ9_COLKA|nr:hypothetical protein CKAH01_14945 [Colletotrichum kahawae]